MKKAEVAAEEVREQDIEMEQQADEVGCSPSRVIFSSVCLTMTEPCLRRGRAWTSQSRQWKDVVLSGVSL